MTLSAPTVSTVPLNPLAMLMGLLQIQGQATTPETTDPNALTGPAFDAIVAELDDQLEKAGLTREDLTDPDKVAMVMIPPALVQHLSRLSVGENGELVLSSTPTPTPTPHVLPPLAAHIPVDPVALGQNPPLVAADLTKDSSALSRDHSVLHTLALADPAATGNGLAPVAPPALNLNPARTIDSNVAPDQTLMTAIMGHLAPLAESEEGDLATIAASLNAMDVGSPEDRIAGIDGADNAARAHSFAKNPAMDAAESPFIQIPVPPTLAAMKNPKLSQTSGDKTLTVIRDPDSVLDLSMGSVGPRASETSTLQSVTGNANDPQPAAVQTMPDQPSWIMASLLGGEGFFGLHTDFAASGTDSASMISPLSPASPGGVASQALATGAAHPASVAVAVHLQKAAAAKETKELTIALNPPELGRVKARLSYNGNDNSLSAHIFVENKDAFMILQRDAHALHNALTNAGVDVGSNGLSFELSGQNQNFDGLMAGNDNQRDGSASREQGQSLDDLNGVDGTGDQNAIWTIDPTSGHQRYNIVV